MASRRLHGITEIAGAGSLASSASRGESGTREGPQSGTYGAWHGVCCHDHGAAFLLEGGGKRIAVLYTQGPGLCGARTVNTIFITHCVFG